MKHLLLLCANSKSLLRRKAQKFRKETGDDRWKAPIEKMQRSVAETVLRSMYRPLLLLALEPMCLNLCIFSAILLGILYLFFGAFQLVFASVYGFTLWQRGLCFMGLFVGMIFAILSDPFWRRNYARLERNYQATHKNDEFQPEWRLPPGEFGLVTEAQAKSDHVSSYFGRTPCHNRALHLCVDGLSQCPLDCTDHWQCLIWCRVSSPDPTLHLDADRLCFARTILVYSGIFTFLVDAYPTFAASALAANSFSRSAFGGVFPLFGIQSKSSEPSYFRSTTRGQAVLCMCRCAGYPAIRWILVHLVPSIAKIRGDTADKSLL